MSESNGQNLAPYQRFIALSRYARFLPELKSRESWEETVQRYVDFMRGHHPIFPADRAYDAIVSMRVMPSMRALMTAGPALDGDAVASYNCAFTPIDDVRAFDEIMYVLMCGCGMGFSVERQSVNKLPEVAEQFHNTGTTIHVDDSRIGWARALRELLGMLYGGHVPQWDLSRLRPAGAPLKTFGGRSSGPEPLNELFKFCVMTFRRAAGRKLNSRECHDIVCKIGDVVVVGGVRRSALLSLSNLSDQRMAAAKSGQWWEHDPQRALANNSVAYTEKPEMGLFMKEWTNLYESKSGERGIFNREGAKRKARSLGDRRNPDHEFGTNPCFAAGTLIVTDKGARPIEDLIGDTVSVHDGVAWREINSFRVTGRQQPMLKITLHDGSVLRVTPAHTMILRDGRRVSAGSLAVGDSLALSTIVYGIHCAERLVASIEPDGIDDMVYCCTVPDTHSVSLAIGITTGNCAEISLRPNSFCNLSEVVVRPEDTLETLRDKVEMASILGTFQSAFTDFRYLRSIWKKNVDEERLLGVSLTGIMDNDLTNGRQGFEFLASALDELRELAIETNKHWAERLHIPASAAITTVKPSGCRPGTALTTTAAGVLTLDELLSDHPDGQIWADYSGDAAVIRDDGCHPIAKTYRNGSQAVYRITMNYGLSVESTDRHPWWITERIDRTRAVSHRPVEAWVATTDIRVNDVLHVNLGVYHNDRHKALISVDVADMDVRAVAIRQPTHMDDRLAWLLGYLWGNGALSPMKWRIRFISQHREHIEKCQHLLMELFDLYAEIKPASDGRDAWGLDCGSRALWEWLHTNEFSKYDFDQIALIPHAVRASAAADIVAFIAGLIDADGCVSVANGMKRTVNWTCADARFAKHVQDVAWAVGLGLGRSHNTKGSNFQAEKSMWLCCLSSHVTEAAFEVLEANCEKIKTSDRTLPFTHQREAKNKGLAGKVLKVELVGEMPTFDVEIKGEPWFYAGAVKSHNTVSQLTDAASGIHPRFDHHYLRTVRNDKKDPLSNFLIEQGVPHETDVTKDSNWVFAFPMKAPPTSKIASEMSAIDQLEHYLVYAKHWAEHSVSITVYVREHEWLHVAAWVYEHFDEVNGLSFLPYTDHIYRQAPYQSLTPEEYETLAAAFPVVDFTQYQVDEHSDNTAGAHMLACVAGVCEI